jgi:putative ABC transport system permease protein
MVGNLIREFKLAFRALARKPTFSTVVVGTLALAIAASTVIYSIVHGVLLQPLPYPGPDRLAGVWQLGKTGRQGQFSDPNFEDLRDQSRAFAAIAEYADGVTTVGVGTTPLRADVATVSRQFFEVFGRSPALGRTFAPQELAVGAAPVAVVSYGFWQRAMGSQDLSVATLRLADRSVTVVGVMPPGFDFPAKAEIWTPREQIERNPHRTGHNWLVVARLAGTLPLSAARADASSVAKRLAVAFGDDTAMADVALVPLQEQIAGSIRRPLLVLLAAVGCLVIIACANLANLMLAHVSGRRRELAVRSALGASRGALALPLLAETTLMSALGGALGIVLGFAGLRVVVSLLPLDLPRRADIGLSWPVLAAALVLIAVTGLVLGAAVAWNAVRADVAESLKQGQRGQTGSTATGRMRNVLVVTQLAVSLVLLVGAGLLGRSLAILLSQATGFRTEQVLTIDLSIADGATAGGPESAAPYPRRVQLHSQLLERLAALPGVESAGGINRFPLGDGYANGTYLKALGDERIDDIKQLSTLFEDRSRTGQAEFRIASGGYFKTMGIPLVRGRLFDERDVADAQHVAVVSESMAKAAWPGKDPIGQVVQFGNMDRNLRVFTVVGVVGDIKERGLDAKPRPTLYGDYRQRPRMTRDFTIALHATRDANALAGPARAVIRELAPDVAPRFRTVDEVYALSVADRRFTLYVLSAFGAAALLLAVLGIYGVLAYVVAQRTQEFGVRMALGAARRDVWRLVLRQAGLLVVACVVLGTAASWALTRLMSTMLFEVTPTDPVTYLSVVAGLSVVALLACQLPAMRATRVDPLIALRAE